MNPHYPHLFSPIKIGSLTLKNRIASAPTSLATLGRGGYPSLENIAYYDLRARGGACMVTLGDVIVDPSGLAHPEAVCLKDPDVVPHIRRVAEAIRSHGAVASIEIDHGGCHCSPAFTPDHKVYGPSAYFNKQFKCQVEPMSVEMIHQLAEAYGQGAAVAKLAEFQMVTVHFGHGWLISQFLSPLTNQRTDEYGGSVENRCRFGLEVIESIRRHCGPDFPIEIRISGSDLTEGGNTLEDTIEICKILDGKVDLIHVSAGNFLNRDTRTVMHPSMFLPHGCNVYLAAAIKKAVKTPVATVGSLSDPDKMEEIIASGQADIVCLARALVADPFLPDKAKHGKVREITPCLRCFECQGGMFATRSIRCAVNPVIGNELEARYALPETTPKKVLVVGGGPAGMKAAITAAQRGHQVILCEKEGELGGAIRYSRHISFKCWLEDYLDHMVYSVGQSGVEVRLNTEVTPELAKEIAPDHLICAVGADPIRLRLPGADLPHVMQAVDAHARQDEIGQRVVIIGGGLVGVELGIALGKEGKQVTVVEMQNKYAPDCNLQHRNALVLEVPRYIDMKLGVTCTEITADGVVGVNGAGESCTYPADTVISAIGYRAKSDTVEALRDCCIDFDWIGDCVRPGKVRDAVRMGYHAALDI